MAVPFAQIGNVEFAERLFLDDGVAGQLVFSEYFSEPTSGADDLSADGVAAGVPALSSPGLGQVHSFSAGSVSASAPVVGSPVIEIVAGVFDLSAIPVDAGAPSVGAPVLGVTVVSNEPPTTGGAMVLATTGRRQRAGSGLWVKVSDDGPERLPGEDQPPVHLYARSVSASRPVCGSPGLGQSHAIAARGIESGSQTTGMPRLGWVQHLSAATVAAGTIVIGTPALRHDDTPELLDILDLIEMAA